MANSPVPAPRDLPSKDERFQELVADLLARGMKPAQVAARLAGEDKKARKAMRARVWRLVRHNAEFQARMAARAKGQKILDLVPASKALGNRAKRGNVNATRLLYEASGYWNPKHVQEHTGEVKITLPGVPRPVAGLEDSPPIDAVVVEED